MGDDSTPTITIDPEPPTQGESVKVCIDPAQSGVVFTVENTGAPDEQHTTGEDGCVTFTVPATATAMSVSGGGAVAASTPIKPS